MDMFSLLVELNWEWFAPEACVVGLFLVMLSDCLYLWQPKCLTLIFEGYKEIKAIFI